MLEEENTVSTKFILLLSAKMSCEINPLTISFSQNNTPYSRKVWQGETLANLLFLSIWRKKVWRVNR